MSVKIVSTKIYYSALNIYKALLWYCLKVHCVGRGLFDDWVDHCIHVQLHEWVNEWVDGKVDG